MLSLKYLFMAIKNVKANISKSGYIYIYGQVHSNTDLCVSDYNCVKNIH